MFIVSEVERGGGSEVERSEVERGGGVEVYWGGGADVERGRG